MIEERHVELIHAELDGELTPEQRAELSRVLLANPEARMLRDQLNRLFGQLARLEDASPPSELSAAVLGALPARVTKGRSQTGGRAWYAGPAFRYAAVFVGGLLISAALLAPGTRDIGGPNVSDLVGTIGGHDAAPRQSAIDRAEIDLPQVTGGVNSYRLGTQLVVELDLRATEPVEVVATHGGQLVRFSLGATAGSGSERVLWLPVAETPAGSGIRLEVYHAGRLLYQGTLRSSGQT